MMILKMEQGSIQVLLDIQAVSKVTDKKCKCNATASHRFQQWHKEKEQETSNIISKLEAQVWEMTEEKTYYQQKWDFLQDVILWNCLLIPPQPLSLRWRRHALLNELQIPDTETSAQNRGRNTQQHISAYVLEELSSHMITAHVSFEAHNTGATTKNIITLLCHSNTKSIPVIALH